MSSQTETTVLVTGGTGFVGTHLVLQLLAAGYTVRTTIRNIAKQRQVRDILEAAGSKGLDRLSFHAADLTKDEGWDDAARGCTYVHHVASPLPVEAPQSEDEIIIPARQGSLRVVRAAHNAGVKRFVFTSSFAAIGYGHDKDIYTEADWSKLEGLAPYHKSKTLAERAVWDFVQNEGHGMELVVVNPVGIFGPALGSDFAASVNIVKQLLQGAMPVCPRIYFNIVDVRDIAALHIRAMVDPAANGQRIIGSSDGRPLSLLDIAKIIREERPTKAQKVPKRELPSWVFRGMAYFSPSARTLAPMLDKTRPIDNSKAKRMLDWVPRDPKETIKDTVDSLFDHKEI